MADLYKHAGAIIDSVRQKRGNARALCLTSKHADKRKLFAVVHQTIKYYGVLVKIIADAGLLKQEKKLSQSTAAALVHDLLFGKRIQCGGPLKKAVMRHKSRLKAELNRAMIKAKVTAPSDLLPARAQLASSMPRYARVNTCLTDLATATSSCIDDGFKLVENIDCSRYRQMEKGTFTVDPHIPNLLVFAPKTDMHDNGLYKCGKLILQDKASCMPAPALNPPPGSHCIDACSAPGNKTSHLAAIMGNKGRVDAFDISPKRLALMNRMLDKAAASCVTTHLQSFLDTDPLDPQFGDVQFVLCDPSCSGSGIISRMDGLLEADPESAEAEAAGDDGPKAKEAEEQARLDALAVFQRDCVLHAMKFPAVVRVSYSTCSVHETENEDVVAAVLAQRPDFELVTALPAWHRRGHVTSACPGARHLVRSDPELDSTHGFFVSVFQRRTGSSAAGPSKNTVGPGPSPSGRQHSRNRRKKEKEREKKREKARKRQREASAGTAAALHTAS